MNPVEEIAAVLRNVGAERYGDNDVSQLQHALQCAALAQADGASVELATAALLHDIGHLVDVHYEGAAEAGRDRRHDRSAAPTWRSGSGRRSPSRSASTSPPSVIFAP